MESAKIFLTSKISEFVKANTTIKILYKHDSLNNEHLIKVLPLHEFNSNSNYKLFEDEILLEFIIRYPNDGLVFLSEDDWIDIKIPDLIFPNYYNYNGIQLILNNETSIKFYDNSLFDITKVEDDFLNVSEIIDSYNQLNLAQQNRVIRLDDPLFGYFENISSHCNFSAIGKKGSENYYDELEFCNCNNFALAA